MTKRSTEEQFDELHGSVGSALNTMVKTFCNPLSADFDPMVAIKVLDSAKGWLKNNGISGAPVTGNAIDELSKLVDASELATKIQDSKGLTPPRTLN